MKELASKDELLELFDEAVHDKIEESLVAYPDSTGIVVFENRMLDSSCLGDRTACLVGPSNTYKTPQECEGKWLNDLPSQRQYPTYYWMIPVEPEKED